MDSSSSELQRPLLEQISTPKLPLRPRPQTLFECLNWYRIEASSATTFKIRVLWYSLCLTCFILAVMAFFRSDTPLDSLRFTGAPNLAFFLICAMIGSFILVAPYLNCLQMPPYIQLSRAYQAVEFGAAQFLPQILIPEDEHSVFFLLGTLFSAVSVFCFFKSRGCQYDLGISVFLLTLFNKFAIKLFRGRKHWEVLCSTIAVVMYVKRLLFCLTKREEDKNKGQEENAETMNSN